MSRAASEYLHEPDHLTPDNPTQSLHEAVHKYNDCRRWRPLDTARDSVEASRDEQVLSLFSWANRSVLQLPLATQTCISRIDDSVSRIGSILQQYGDFIRDSESPNGLSPTQMIDRTLNMVTNLEPEVLMLLKAAYGSEGSISQTAGNAALEAFLGEQGPSLPSHYRSRVAELSRCTDKVNILEHLISYRAGFETLKEASKHLSKLKTHITDHYTYKDDGTPPTYKHNQAPEFALDLNVGKLHSVVVSMSADPAWETEAAEILNDAYGFYACERLAYESKPTQIINRLQYLYSEARETCAEDETAHIMTGLCRFVAECEENDSSLYTVNGRRPRGPPIPFRPTQTRSSNPYSSLHE